MDALRSDETVLVTINILCIDTLVGRMNQTLHKIMADSPMFLLPMFSTLVSQAPTRSPTSAPTSRAPTASPTTGAPTPTSFMTVQDGLLLVRDWATFQVCA